MILCSNCDIEAASYKCSQCPPNECAFCAECKGLHSQIKAFRGHQFADLPKQVVLCSNCEQSESKFICRDCDESNKNLCLGCSVIHPKIKAFRNHNVMQLSGNPGSSLKARAPFSLSTNSIGDTFAYFIDAAYDNLSKRPLTDIVLWQTVAICSAVTIAYYTIVNIIFRKYSSLVNIGLAIWLFQWLQSSKFKVSDADKSLTEPLKKNGSPTLASLSQKLSSIGGIFSSAPTPRISATWADVDASISSADSNFKGEFWYNTEGKKASLRPRGRPYRARRPLGSATDDPAPSPNKQE